MINPSFSDADQNIEARTRDALSKFLAAGRAARHTRELYDTRLLWELQHIHHVGLEPYIAAVTELVDHARFFGILVGPGRKRSPASLVLYLLGVTQIDPVANGLVVECWFSNPEIEIDVEWHRRDELIDYIWERYGAEHAAYISTYKRDKESGDILSREVHAACYAISSRTIADLLPIWQADNGRMVIDADRNAVATRGICILTILGMKQLSAVAETVKQIKRVLPDFSVHDIPIEDKSTMDLFRQGQTDDVFLFDSTRMRDLLRISQPVDRHDLVFLHATNFPHLLSDKTISTVIHYMSRRSKRVETTNGDHEVINDLLRDTFGILLFQEQFIEIVHKITGWSLRESEQYRQLARKNVNNIELQNELFGARQDGTSLSKEQENRLRSLIAGSGNTISKSHAVSYVRIGWMMGYLKTHYEEEFKAGLADASVPRVP